MPGLRDYELLPFHNYGACKYTQLGLQYKLGEIQPPDRTKLELLNNKFRKALNLL